MTDLVDRLLELAYLPEWSDIEQEDEFNSIKSELKENQRIINELREVQLYHGLSLGLKHYLMNSSKNEPKK